MRDYNYVRLGKSDKVKRSLPFPLNIIMWLVRTIAKKIMTIILIAGLSYGGFYYYMHQTPEREKQYDKIMAIRKQIPEQLGGLLYTMGMTDLADILGYTPPKGGDATGVNLPAGLQALVEKHTQSTTGNATDNIVTPPELSPVLEVLKRTKHYPAIRERLAVARVGEHGEQAVPLLEKMLNSDNRKLSDAARESLRRIGTPEAIALLGE